MTRGAGCSRVLLGVKGVGDVLAGRGAGSSAGFHVLRWCEGSVTCLLGVEQVVEELFAVVKGVGDVLAGRGDGCGSLLARASVTCLLGGC